jgi:hypothetical protein
MVLNRVLVCARGSLQTASGMPCQPPTRFALQETMFCSLSRTHGSAWCQAEQQIAQKRLLTEIEPSDFLRRSGSLDATHDFTAKTRNNHALAILILLQVVSGEMSCLICSLVFCAPHLSSLP